MDATQGDDETEVGLAGHRNAETAEGGGELRIAENAFSAQHLGGDSAHHLGHDVGPVEGSEDVALDASGPVQRTTTILQNKNIQRHVLHH